MKIRNIIFDVDGTLLDSKRDIAGAQNWVLQQLGIDRYRREDLYPYIGKTLQEIFSLLLPESLHHRIPEAAAMYREYYRPRALETTVLFPNVETTVAKLRNWGISLAVATTKSSETTRKMLKHFHIDEYFSQIQGTDEMPYKPDPFIIDKIFSEQLWERTETLMVGDTDKDIETGQNAGIFTCGVTYGSMIRQQLEKYRSDYIIENIQELLILVDN
jgi:phosphoglycolate phosphatase-like HAD superfamily hydrolase